MGDLILNSLEIRNFQGFQHLTIDHLGRVNLIVGKNNIGKSSLLEALRLYTRRGSPEVIWEILELRDESRNSPYSRSVKIEELLLSLRFLFHGRKEIRTLIEPISIGPVSMFNDTLVISIGWFVSQEGENGIRRIQLLDPKEFDQAENPYPRFTIQMGNQIKANYPLRPDPLTPSRALNSEEGVNCIYISANGLDSEQSALLWDDIALTPLENEVLKALRIIAPGVDGLNYRDSQAARLVNNRDGRSLRTRIPIVRITGIDEPIPLKNLGDGMQRILGIALALVNAQDGMLLIDEIENGIHYSAQTELWRLIFELAQRLNVQVFATTHGWDCIEGFQKAAQENTQEEGMLIRLSLKGDDVISTIFDERKLAIATRQQIEVR